MNEGTGSFKFVGSRPVVVDFYAPWCGPCRMLSPVVEELSMEYAGRVDFYKVDVDKEEKLAGMFGIRSIPTLFLIPKKGAILRIQGAVGKSQLKEKIESLGVLPA